MEKINKDITIGEVVGKFPSAAEVLMNRGIQCVGCGAANFETIEEGLKGHGKSDEEILEIINEMNDSIDDGFDPDAVLNVTKKATDKLKELLVKQKKEGYALRIMVISGGCSGYQYGFDLEEKPKDNDEVIKIDDVMFLIDKESISMIKGANVDYIETIQGSGFKIVNPNAKSTCGCGNSFS